MQSRNFLKFPLRGATAGQVIKLSYAQRVRLVWLCATAIVCLYLAAPTQLFAQGQTDSGTDSVERIDYLTFAHGAMPVSIEVGGAASGVNFEHAVRIIDGDTAGFPFVNRAAADTATEFVYELPALTTFDRLAVPDILETPSPAQTFTRLVEVYGSTEGPAAGFTLLASATLETHGAPGLITELAIQALTPVRWVKLRLVGGINILQEQSFFEFGEIIGNGIQQLPELATHFDGTWRRSALRLRLQQEGPLVSGCYDQDGLLSGTATGNLVHAIGTTQAGIPSAFIIGLTLEGEIRGVRSDNNGPFRLYTLPAVAELPVGSCGQPPPPVLGCGAVIHGITFAFDAADIREDSEPVLAELYRGLQADALVKILIEGHTSSEGSETYNQLLSERRAQAVVANLVARGLAENRIGAAGLGEIRPIASNSDESGRSLNRRVEVHCQ